MPHLTRETPQGRTEVGALCPVLPWAIRRTRDGEANRSPMLRPNISGPRRAGTRQVRYPLSVPMLLLLSLPQLWRESANSHRRYCPYQSPINSRARSLARSMGLNYQGASGEVSPNHSINIARWGCAVNRGNRTFRVGKPPYCCNCFAWQ